MSGATLKWIAIITMIIDHIGAIFFQELGLLRIIGRLAFPIFAFLITEGYRYTRNIKKYAIRLGIFALVSEIPFNLAFYRNPWDISHQNVFFTLVLGLLCIWIYEEWKDKNRFLSLVAIYMLALLAEILRTDYGLFGVFLIFMIYQSKTIKGKMLAIVIMNGLLAWLNLLAGATSIIQIYAGISVIFLLFYNEKKGKGFKFVFYLIYPFHLILFYILKLLFVA
jgi:hypothetical protein